MKSAKTYLILKATRRSYGVTNPETGLRPVDSVGVVGSRVNRPVMLGRDQIAVREAGEQA